MDALSLHFCFQLQDGALETEEVWEILQSFPSEFINADGLPTTVEVAGGGKMLIATAENGTHLVLHAYTSGMITMDIQYDSSKIASNRLMHLVSNAAIKRAEDRVKELFGSKCLFTRGLPTAVKRGRVCPYFARSDNALFEHRPLSLVYEVNSQWQNIKIYKTRESGNMLCLDDDIMIAEEDENYNLTLLGVDRHSYTDKTVLILGGGDGGLLHELLKHSPKHVIMVEIDIEVIKACRMHMRKMCGDALDALEGENYKIRIEDCQDVLQECLQRSRKFDFVVNDLSEYLINTGVGYDYDYTTSAKLLEWSIQSLKPNGKYLSRGDTVSNQVSIDAFEREVTSHGLLFEKFIIDVPSFGENACLKYGNPLFTTRTGFETSSTYTRTVCNMIEKAFSALVRQRSKV